MVEGQGSKTFSTVKHLIYNNPQLAHSLLDKIADAAAAYLRAKIDAGVDAVQLFDTWGGLLSQDDFEEFSLRYIRKIISKVKEKDVPVIVFAKGVHYLLNRLAECGADVLGLDWTMNIGEVRETGPGPFMAERFIACLEDGRDEPVPAYQVYVVLGFLKDRGLLTQMGRDGYLAEGGLPILAATAWDDTSARSSSQEQ